MLLLSTSDPPLSTLAPKAGGRSYHHGALRRALVDAARALLEEAGPEALSLRDVARRVGVSHNAPYRHFPTRQALLAAIAADGFDRLASLLGPEAGLAALGRAYLGFARHHPGLFRLMFDGTLEKSAHPELGQAAAAAYAVLRAAVAPLAPEAERRGATVLAWAQLHGLALLALAGQLNEE